MENLDLDLNFLSGFVDEQRSAGLPDYDPARSLGGGASALPTSTLNFKAYKQEQPSYGSYAQSSAPSTTGAADKAAGFAPVQVGAPAQSSAEANASLQLKVNSKQVWGKESPAAAEDDKSKSAPTTEPAATAMPGMQPATSSTAPKKAEPAKPYVDEKKEKMKNALFSGISAKKDSDDSDDDKKKEEKLEPAGEVNLLDFDSGPS